MGKSIPKTLTREEYESKMLKHIESIRRLMKRFNPEADHVSMTIIGNYEWALTYIDGTDGKEDRKISDWVYRHTASEGIDPYFESKELPNEE